MGQASTYEGAYVGDGLDTYFRLVAQRRGELVVVNSTDMADLLVRRPSRRCATAGQVSRPRPRPPPPATAGSGKSCFGALRLPLVFRTGQRGYASL